MEKDAAAAVPKLSDGVPVKIKCVVIGTGVRTDT
jgi:hypothetical protein